MTPIDRILSSSRIIAIVGLSLDPERYSHKVAEYMQAHGYRIVPVNPVYAGQSILGQRCCATLAEAADALALARIDIVACFRQPDQIPAIAQDAIAVGARCLWLQLDIVNDEAAATARAAGLEVVMDACLMIEHRRLRSEREALAGSGSIAGTCADATSIRAEADASAAVSIAAGAAAGTAL